MVVDAHISSLGYLWCALCVCKSLCKLTRGGKSLPKRKTIIEDVGNIIQDFKTVMLGL